jgi:hypothetical protein
MFHLGQFQVGRPLSTLYQQPLRDPAMPYIYNRQLRSPFPPYMGAVIPPAVARHLDRVQDVARTTKAAMQAIQKLYVDRYYHLCASTDYKVHNAHIRSINHLLNWKDDFLGRDATPPFATWSAYEILNQTLCPAPKIPLSVIDVTLDKDSYTVYYENLMNLRVQYIQGVYQDWLAAKRRMEELIIAAPISEMDRRNWLRWWVDYIAKMRRWEGSVLRMIPPTWEDISFEIRDLVGVAVDCSTASWDADISLPIQPCSLGTYMPSPYV